jgi:hypothetical protein
VFSAGKRPIVIKRHNELIANKLTTTNKLAGTLISHDGFAARVGRSANLSFVAKLCALLQPTAVTLRLILNVSILLDANPARSVSYVNDNTGEK